MLALPQDHFRVAVLNRKQSTWTKNAPHKRSLVLGKGENEDYVRDAEISLTGGIDFP
jgi:hypothetical protein